jgi:hypothetical protein
LKGEKVMKFVEVKEVPNKRNYNPLRSKWEEFMAMNIKVAKIDFEGRNYSSVEGARATMAISVKRAGLPITVTRRGDEIYLIRRDM